MQKRWKRRKLEKKINANPENAAATKTKLKKEARKARIEEDRFVTPDISWTSGAGPSLEAYTMTRSNAID